MQITISQVYLSLVPCSISLPTLSHCLNQFDGALYSTLKLLTEFLFDHGFGWKHFHTQNRQ